MKENKLYIAAFLISIALFFVIGFLYGKISTKDYECTQKPLNYGIEKFNEANDDYFSCNCYGSKTSFSFNSELIDLKGINEKLFIENSNKKEVKPIDNSYLYNITFLPQK